MCGIGGIVQLDKRKQLSRLNQIRAIALLTGLQSRGDQAWGVFLKKIKNNENLNCGVKDDTLSGELFKLPGSVSEFFSYRESKIDLNHTSLILMHTRQSTKGSPEENINNHPFSTDDFILAHNGSISNADELIKKFNIKTDIECDSYIILALIQHFYDENGNNVVEAIKETTKELTGGFACWLYHKSSSDIYLFKHFNPMCYYMDANEGTFIFASSFKYIIDIYNNLITSTDITEVEADKICKIEKDGKLAVLDKFEHKDYAITPYNNTGRTSQITSSYYPMDIDFDVLDIDLSLIKLYEMFEQYESKDKTDTVIALTGNALILLVKPEELIKELDAKGFAEFKSISKIYNSEYFRYIIKPPTRINYLIKHLNDDAKTDDDIKYITCICPKNTQDTDINDEDTETEIKTKYIDVIFDVCDSLDLEYELNEVSNEVTLAYDDNNKPIPPEIRDMFKRHGLTFSPSNKLNYKENIYHMSKLLKIAGELEEEEIC